MQGNSVNLVLLGLPILFFGLQLRRRNEQPYSGWLLGWILVFFSYLIWDVLPIFPAKEHLLQVARFDSLAVGIASFLLSFIRREVGPRRTLILGATFLVPGLLLVDLFLLHQGSVRLLESLAVFNLLSTCLAVHRLVPHRWTHRRWLFYGLAGWTFVFVLSALRIDPTRFLLEAFLGPQLFCLSVLHLASSRSSQTVRALGAIGFLLWAEFYLFNDFLSPSSHTLKLIYQFWDLPKYFVGTSMILELFEASRRQVEGLAERYRLLYENLNMLYEGHPHPMWIYGTRSRQILSANRATVQRYGYPLPELLAMSTNALELPAEADSDDMPAPDAGIPQLLDPEILAPGSRRTQHLHSDGEVVSVVVTERKLLFEGTDAVVVLAVDVTEQDRLHQDLFHRANHDTLTQLPNRELLADRVAQVLAASHRDGRCAVLLTIDVDNFKRINDTYGHPIGDECLKLVAARLQSRIRQVDTLARTGGEEFTAIIGGLSRREDAETVAESLRRLFDPPLMLEDHVLQVTVSIGGALFPEDGSDLETLARRSDAALYRAKRAGRNRCIFAAA